MKRKDYKEVSPEPKDYGGSDYSDDRSPSSWEAAGRDDNDLYIWDEVPKEKKILYKANLFFCSAISVFSTMS
jgi:hypothetical protein